MYSLEYPPISYKLAWGVLQLSTEDWTEDETETLIFYDQFSRKICRLTITLLDKDHLVSQLISGDKQCIEIVEKYKINSFSGKCFNVG